MTWTNGRSRSFSTVVPGRRRFGSTWVRSVPGESTSPAIRSALAGESYGTIRAAALVQQLQLGLLDSVTFNGVILVSAALDAGTFLGGRGNELPYVTNLPTYAATAYYHDALPKKPADFGAFVKEVEDFSSSEYLSALFQGDSLPEEAKMEVAEKLHRYTGLPVDYILESDLRVDARRFAKELFHDRGKALAVHDTRFVGKDPDPVSDTVSIDPFLFNIGGPFSAAINKRANPRHRASPIQRWDARI